MERITERKTLSFNKGMTNVPSDLLSDDSELLESDGFIFKDGEMKPIQKPVKIKALGGELGAGSTIMYVHKMADYKCIITKLEHTESIICYKMNGDQIDINSGQSFSIGAPSDIKSVGNTLVCATEKGIHYLLYKGGKYVDLGTELPKISFFPYLKPDNKDWVKDCSPANLEGFLSYVDAKCNYDSNNNLCSVEYLSTISGSGDSIRTQIINNNPAAKYYKYHCFYVNSNNVQNASHVQDAIKGHISGQINRVKKENRFAFPFFIRFALKLYDGTITKISNPIIVYSCIRKNSLLFPVDKTGFNDINGSPYYSQSNGEEVSYLFAYDIKSYSLKFKAHLDNAKNWSDIIQSVVVYASDDVYPFKLDKKWSIAYPNKTYNQIYHDRCIDGKYESFLYNFNYPRINDGMYPFSTFLPEFKSDKEIEKELLDNSVFYKLFEMDISKSEYFNGAECDADSLMNKYVVENLNVQEQLNKDDYYSWTKFQAEQMFAYNGRLNLVGPKRYPFKGFNIFRADYTNPSEPYETIKFYVHIVSQTMDTWEESDILTIEKDYQLYNDWYYYPDPNAKEMLIVVSRQSDGTTLYYNVSLKIHPRLNGSYSFNALPPESLGIGSNIANITTGGYEDLNSQIFTSVVNNPFVFEASGDNTVGTGKILGIIANTEAVSQGQFGQYPLMVFTDEGIYGMSVNSEGLYSASYPISREVSNESSPLVPTDRLVFFTSKKGLMAASGGSVACMSEQLKGRTSNGADITSEGRFLDFIKDCMIAYDYRDSLLRIYNKSKSYQYIYNMVDKTFSVVSNDVFVKAVVNDYPDNLIQDTEGNVYTLTGKPDVFNDDRLYSGEIITRPLKLGGSMILKSIRDIKHLCDTINGTLQLEIFGSNDCREWTQLTSTGGKPYKYYTFKYIFNNFLAGDSFAGSVVEIQRRREDKMR